MNTPDLSIIIISYNRPDDMLELAKNISELDYLDLLAEVIVVNNHSSVSYEGVERFIQDNSAIPFRYFQMEENLGVSKGRNYAIQQSNAAILVFLDDDALFQNKDALLQVNNIFSEANKNGRKTGIAAFKVYYHSTFELQRNAFPHKQFNQMKTLSHFDTYYFAGCAHTIRKEVFQNVGYYPENFFYGMEEYDLSYRTINAGYKIIYDDRVTVLHKESPFGRLTNKEKLRGMWVNKATVAWKYLPVQYFYSTSLLWSFQYLKETLRFNGWIKGWQQIFKIPGNEKRHPLHKECITYLQKVKARLWY
ncbi:MAG: glycosyltransferase family 2 protein [Chitinophagaceae bacterium]